MQRTEINHVKFDQPEPTVINIWLYLSSCYTFLLNVYVGLINTVPIWTCLTVYYATFAHCFHHVAGSCSAHAFQTQTLKRSLLKGQHIWNEDSQASARGVVIRQVAHILMKVPGRHGPRSSSTLWLSWPYATIIWTKAMGIISKPDLLHPCQVLVWCKSEADFKVIFKLCILYMRIYKQVSLFAVIAFWKVGMKPGSANTEKFLPKEVQS